MLGKTPENNQKDAVHVAIISVEAGQYLNPGAHVELKNDKAFAKDPHSDFEFKAVGIVDPFLKNGIKKGENFYLCLYPETVTGMRHEWNHPAFDETASIKDQLQKIALEYHIDYNHLIEACEAFARGEDFCFWGDYGPDMMYDRGREIAQLYYQLTGDMIDPDQCSFRCAC